MMKTGGEESGFKASQDVNKISKEFSSLSLFVNDREWVDE